MMVDAVDAVDAVDVPEVPDVPDPGTMLVVVEVQLPEVPTTKVRRRRGKAKHTVTLICAGCQQPFQVAAHNATRAKCCSPTCRSRKHTKDKEDRGEIFRWSQPRRTPEERERDLASLSPEERTLLDKFLAEDRAFVVETLGAGAEDAQAIAQHASARHLLLAEGVMDDTEVLVDGIQRLLRWYNELLKSS